MAEVGAFKANQDRNPKANQNQRPWKENLKRLNAFRLTPALVTDGEVHLGQNEIGVRIDRPNLSFDNVHQKL